ncbi:MAG: hypothetical protein HRU51_02595, partial [Xanthomonadales bacterium]|nr:hypothetical protein [Xanthomonadales bacterium]
AVFAVDRYEALARKDIDPVAGLTDRVGRPPLSGPLYVYAQMPMGEEFQRFQDSVMFGGAPDLERRTEYWVRHSDAREAILAQAQPLASVLARLPEHEALIRDLATQVNQPLGEMVFVPLLGKDDRDFLAVLDPLTAEITAVAPTGSWVWQDFAKEP